LIFLLTFCRTIFIHLSLITYLSVRRGGGKDFLIFLLDFEIQLTVFYNHFYFTIRTFCPRFNFLGRTLTDNSAAIDLAALKTIYANRESGINNGGTYGCTIMVLGEKPELHISPGRPDVEPFQVLDFSPRTSGPSSAGQKLN